jgi:hypothetical protein
MPMTKDQREALLASVAKSIVVTLQNSSRFGYKLNDAVNEAVKDVIDVSVEDAVNEIIEDYVDNMDWSIECEDLDLSDIELGTQSSKFAVNRESTYTVDNHVFYGGYKPENLEQLIAFMHFACQDVSFLEHAKRISRMTEILESL